MIDLSVDMQYYASPILTTSLTSSVTSIHDLTSPLLVFITAILIPCPTIFNAIS